MVMVEWETAEIHHSVEMEGHVEIEGPVRIGPNVRIAAGVVLKGPCVIGEGSYIGNNTLIRPYTALGAGSVVGYGCELKNCVIMDKVALGRLSFVGDSVVGEGARLGTGATTVNQVDGLGEISVETLEGVVATGLTKLGAFVGDESDIGARNVIAPGSLLKKGCKVPHLITLESDR